MQNLDTSSFLSRLEYIINNPGANKTQSDEKTEDLTRIGLKYLQNAQVQEETKIKILDKLFTVIHTLDPQKKHKSSIRKVVQTTSNLVSQKGSQAPPPNSLAQLVRDKFFDKDDRFRAYTNIEAWKYEKSWKQRLLSVIFFWKSIPEWYRNKQMNKALDVIKTYAFPGHLSKSYNEAKDYADTFQNFGVYERQVFYKDEYSPSGYGRIVQLPDGTRGDFRVPSNYTLASLDLDNPENSMQLLKEANVKIELEETNSVDDVLEELDPGEYAIIRQKSDEFLTGKSDILFFKGEENVSPIVSKPAGTWNLRNIERNLNTLKDCYKKNKNVHKKLKEQAEEKNKFYVVDNPKKIKQTLENEEKIDRPVLISRHHAIPNKTPRLLTGSLLTGIGEIPKIPSPYFKEHDAFFRIPGKDHPNLAKKTVVDGTLAEFFDIALEGGNEMELNTGLQILQLSALENAGKIKSSFSPDTSPLPDQNEYYLVPDNQNPESLTMHIYRDEEWKKHQLNLNTQSILAQVENVIEEKEDAETFDPNLDQIKVKAEGEKIKMTTITVDTFSGKKRIYFKNPE